MPVLSEPLSLRTAGVPAAAPCARPAELLTAGYLLATGLLVASLGDPPMAWGSTLLFHTIGIALMLGVLPRLRATGWPAVVRDWLPVLAPPLFYAEVAHLNQLLGMGYHDGTIQVLEGALFVTASGAQPGVALRHLLPWPAVGEYLHFSYFAYYLLLPLLAGVLYFHGRIREYRYVVATVLGTFYLCFLCFIVFPVAGPWYRLPHPSASAIGAFFPHLVHMVLARAASKGAAFPSSHVAVAVVIWLLAWRFARRVFWLLALIVPTLAVGTVYGGFHYAIDVAAGAAVGILCYLIGPRINRMLGGDTVDLHSEPTWS
jgi:membrane-associated phospholipid phosphatase